MSEALQSSALALWDIFKWPVLVFALVAIIYRVLKRILKGVVGLGRGE